MTGGGAYNPSAGFVNSGGGFRCLADITAGPFNGCLSQQGVRWDTAALLRSTAFQCTGADVVKTANTGNATVVLLADSTGKGMENIESFTAKMIVSESDSMAEHQGTSDFVIHWARALRSVAPCSQHFRPVTATSACSSNGNTSPRRAEFSARISRESSDFATPSAALWLTSASASGTSI